MTRRFQDKVTLITGASRGIGRSLAGAFAGEGSRVVLTARTQSELEAAAHQIEREHRVRALPIVCDVSDEAQVKHAVETAVSELGRVDVLINNAAITNIRPVYGLTHSGWERTLAINLTGTFLFTKHVWKPMKNQGGGVIINISSIGGRKGYPLLSAYCASKWGQIGFSLAAAEEGKADNIRVNVVAPGKADTAFRAQIKEDKTQMLTADDCNGICLFLASDEAKWVNGQVVEVEWFGPNKA
ncbi:MAG: SDR family oxidoreductase [Chloroflexi bacterium]|nr:SDR family oxidoreductase [Chloroflexota bacterium]